MTLLDNAHASMEANPQDESARRQFYGLLAASELFLVLEAEAEGDMARPKVLVTEDGKVAVAFDTEERLASFSDQPVPYLALSGRRVIALLADSGVSLGFNLVGAPSAIVLPPDVLDWIAGVTAGQVNSQTQLPDRVFPPKQASERFLKAIDERLASMAGLADKAYLVSVGDGSELVLVVSGAPDAARSEILNLLAEARNFAAPEQQFSVGFIEVDGTAEARFGQAGLRFDIPHPVRPEQRHVAPGSDPDKPPVLR